MINCEEPIRFYLEESQRSQCLQIPCNLIDIWQAIKYIIRNTEFQMLQVLLLNDGCLSIANSYLCY